MVIISAGIDLSVGSLFSPGRVFSCSGDVLLGVELGAGAFLGVLIAGLTELVQWSSNC